MLDCQLEFQRWFQPDWSDQVRVSCNRPSQPPTPPQRVEPGLAKTASAAKVRAWGSLLVKADQARAPLLVSAKVPEPALKEKPNRSPFMPRKSRIRNWMLAVQPHLSAGEPHLSVKGLVVMVAQAAIFGF